MPSGDKLLLFTGDLVEASPYHIYVTPGSTTVPRGSDQVISAKIQGFAADSAELMVRKAVNQPFEHVPMVYNQDTKSFDGMLFDLPTSIDYFVEAGGVRSSPFVWLSLLGTFPIERHGSCIIYPEQSVVVCPRSRLPRMPN